MECGARFLPLSPENRPQQMALLLAKFRSPDHEHSRSHWEHLDAVNKVIPPPKPGSIVHFVLEENACRNKIEIFNIKQLLEATPSNNSSTNHVLSRETSGKLTFDLRKGQPVTWFVTKSAGWCGLSSVIRKNSRMVVAQRESMVMPSSRKGSLCNTMPHNCIPYLNLGVSQNWGPPKNP